MDDVALIDEVADYAAGVLAEWVGGYSVPDDEPQQRFRTESVDEYGGVTVCVETCDPFPRDPRYFRITVSVEELEA